MTNLFKALKKSRFASSAVSVILAFSVLLSTFAGLSLFAASDVWDGSVADSYASGSGTSGDPFVIETAAQLKKLVTDTETEGKFFLLANDIYLNVTTDINWAKAPDAKKWVEPVSKEGVSFKGKLDGQGHKVFGLYIDATVADDTPTKAEAVTWGAGLFPVVGTNAEIKGVGIEGAYISVKNSGSDAGIPYYAAVGGLVGLMNGENIHISLCYQSEDTYLEGTYAGLIGYSNDSTVSVTSTVVGCYSLGSATVPDSKDAGFEGNRIGVLGANVTSDAVLFDNCYAIGNVSGNLNKPLGSEKTSYCTSNWGANVANPSVKNITGSVAASSMPLLDWETTYRTTTGYPVLQLFAPTAIIPPSYDVWDGTASGDGITGSGTTADPYLIKTPEQFAYAMQKCGDLGDQTEDYIKLANDIYLNDISAINWATGTPKAGYTVNKWTPNKFNGILDGGGHMIYGLYVDTNPVSYAGAYHNAGAGVGLVASDRCSEWSWISFKNLGMDKVYVHGANCVSAFIGTLSNCPNNKVYFESCYLGSDVTLKGYCAGGFVGGGGAENINHGLKILNSVSLVTRMTAAGGKYGDFLGDVWGNNYMEVKNLFSINKFFGNSGGAPKYHSNLYSKNYGAQGWVVKVDDPTGYDALTKMSPLEGMRSTDSYPVPAVLYQAITGIWDGTSEIPTKGGDGSSADKAIEIHTASELAGLFSWANRHGDGKYYKLMSDIYLNDINAINWETGEVAGGYTLNTWNSAPFKGHVDGNGHVIYGLYNDKNPGQYTENYANETGLGLISDEYTTLPISFKNLGLDNVFFDGPHSVGAFVGNVRGDYGITFDSCYTGEKVTLTGFSVGSFVAYGNKKVDIKNSYSLTTRMNVKAANKLPGMLGSGIWDGGKTVENCFSLDRLFGNGMATVTNSYGVLPYGESYPTVSADKMVGALAETYMPNLDWENHFVTTDRYPTLKLFAPLAVEDSEVWDGSKIKPSEGSGSAEDPYLIYTAEEFAWALTSTTGSTLTSCYKLTRDIYLNDITKINWETGEVTDASYTPRTWTPADFAGTVDGNGHLVYGLYINRSAAVTKEDYGAGGVGLVSANWHGASANFEKLGLDKAYIRGASSSAGFVANAKKGGVSIDRCYVGKDVTVKGYTAAGMVAGGADPISVTNSYSLATRVSSTSTSYVAGILGNAWGARTIVGCYSVGVLYDNGNPANVTGSYSAARRTSFDVVLEEADMKGMDALTNAAKMPLLGYAFTATEGYPELCVFAGIEEVKPSEDPTVWDGRTVTKPSGSGTAMDPYIIRDGAELAWAMSGKDNGKVFRLVSDIKLNEPEAIDWTTGKVIKAGYTARTWQGGKFAGTLEGDGHVIYGLYINSGATSGSWDWSGIGLISESAGPVNIQMTGIDKAYICGANAVAAFVGVNKDGSATLTFSESYVGADVTVKGYSAGGFVGVSSRPVNISSCYSQIADNRLVKWADTSVTTPALRGGFVADGWGGNYISNSYSIAPITGHKADLSGCYFGTATTDKEGNSNYRTLLTADKMQGLDVLSNTQKMPALGNKFYATSGYPTLKVFEEGTNFSDVEGDIWSGKLARTLKGKGTKAEPYEITNGAELAFAVSKGGFGGAYFVITKDIYLNDVTAANWKSNAKNNVWLSDTEGFNGHIDGQGHIVYGIWYPETHSGTASGLIPIFKEGTIEKVGVRYAQIYGQMYAGGIVGRDLDQTYTSKTIRQCFADDTVYVKFTATSATHKEPYGGAAGIVGYASPNTNGTSLLTIDTCYSKATLGGWDGGRLNGIIGTAWASKYVIKNCYSYKYKPFSGLNKNTASYLITMGGEEALPNTEYVYENIYTNVGAAAGFEDFVTLSSANMTDADAKVNMKGFDFEKVWETVFDATPKLKVFKDYDGKATVDAEEAANFAGGAGTMRNPYIIKTVAQLRYLVTSDGTAGKHYKLANDLYINDTTKKNWKVLNPQTWYGTNGQGATFEGTFDGDGHFIYGLYMNETPQKYDNNNFIPYATALFPWVKGSATIKNVHIRSSYISGTGYAAAIVGYIGSGNNDITVMGCSADTSVTIKGQTTGGLVGGGYKKLSLYYSYFTGTLQATAASVGRQNGLVGDIWYTDQEVVECYTFEPSAYRPGYTPDLRFSLYATGVGSGVTTLTEAQMTGPAAKKNMADLDWDKVWTVKAGKTPHPKVIVGDPVFSIYDEGEKGRVWSGKLASKFAGGTGTEADPYIIETPEQMAYLVSLGEGGTAGKFFKLTADLKMNDAGYSGWQANARPWISTSADFCGHFDGDGHVVSGLYFDGTAREMALFPCAGGGAVIEKVGLTRSYLVSKIGGTTVETYVASFIGYCRNLRDGQFPVVSQCFADTSVYLEGHFVGGLVCGSPFAFTIDNCYFVGEITADDHHGTMIGNTWDNGTYISTITDSFSSSLDRNKISSNNGTAHMILKNYYHDGDANVAGAISLNMMYMRGARARESMNGLDYKNIWMIVEGGTPVLRCFKNAAKYSCTREPVKNSISFVTGDGEPCDPIYGIAGWDKVPELPTTSRYGYEFGGWYFFDECILPAEFDTFPYFDCFVYAKWIPLGFTQGFDNQIDEAYDFGPGAELFKPGVKGYNPKYIRGGLRSAHAKGDGENDAVFLLSYDNMLEVGKEYEMTFWMTTNTDGASGKVEMLHANHGQYDSDVVGSQVLVEFDGLTAGKWSQYKVVFTANAPFLLFKVDKGLSLYFDDVEVTPTGKDGELGKDIIGFNPGSVQTEPQKDGGDMTLVIILSIVGGVILLAAIATVVIIFVKKGKKTKV